MANGYQGQIQGGFKKDKDIYPMIKANSSIEIKKITHLGIQTNPENIFYINGEQYEMGTTGVYEINNCDVTSIYFGQDVDNNTIIDYVVH